MQYRSEPNNLKSIPMADAYTCLVLEFPKLHELFSHSCQHIIFSLVNCFPTYTIPLPAHMAPLESEWMLWAKRLRYEHKFLLHRLEAAEKAATKNGIPSDTIKDLTTEHHDMNERVRKLEEYVAQRENDAGSDVAKLQGIIAGLEKEIAHIAGNLNDWKKDWAQCLEKERVNENKKQPCAAFSSIPARVAASRKAKRGSA